MSTPALDSINKCKTSIEIHCFLYIKKFIYILERKAYMLDKVTFDLWKKRLNYIKAEEKGPVQWKLLLYLSQYISVRWSLIIYPSVLQNINNTGHVLFSILFL